MLTLEALAEMSGVSSSHLGRIERGERFPSAQILRKIAKPLDCKESDLLIWGNYLSHPDDEGNVEDSIAGLDPYVAKVLSQEPADVQLAVIGILNILKSIAKVVNEADRKERSEQN